MNIFMESQNEEIRGQMEVRQNQNGSDHLK